VHAERAAAAGAVDVTGGAGSRDVPIVGAPCITTNAMIATIAIGIPNSAR
jgi:hypothetical protein